MTATAPPPVECQILHFKHLYKLETRHDVSKNTYRKPTNLVAVSSLHGLTFVGESNALKVIATFNLYGETQNFSNKSLNQYHHRNIVLPASPTHIDINAEQKLLAVVFVHNNVPILRVYVIASFLYQDVIHFPEIRLSSTETTYLTDLSWNPGIPNILACCISDGSLSTYTFNAPDSFEVKSLPRESASVCVCWSPKGKQIVVGNYNGYLTQYLPELKAVKNVPPPTGLFRKACTLCSVKWISNFQFIGVYKTQESGLTDEDEIKSCVVVINTPKNEPVQYINYDDVCFSSGTDRPVQFYFNHIPSWNLIFVSSSNSLEVAVLSLGQDNHTWVLWNLEPEEMRITLPYLKSGEAFPVGVAIDYNVPFQLSIDDKTVQFPALSIMTCEGLLCIYWINYLNFAVPNVCSAVSGPASLQYFTSQFIVNEESAPKEVSDVVPAQDSPSSGDLGGIGYNVEQSSPQIQEAVSLADTTLKNTQEQLQIRSVALLNELSSAFDFEASLAKEMVAKPTNIESTRTSVSFGREAQHESTLTSKKKEQGSPSLSMSEASGVINKTENQKPRLEAVKKLKKRASVFENDIQEIKYLVNNIHIGTNEPRLQMSEEFDVLEDISGKLKVTNSKLRSDIDHLRTSVIEVFACVQDVKSKLFLLTNPGYQSLTGAQDIDPVSSNNLNTIRSTINYVRTQVESANKQLEGTWFKFSQNSVAPSTKVPILENVYETMVKQQKILGYLKLQTEKLEKRFTAMIQRLCREKRYVSLKNKVPWSMEKLLNENMSLDDLTKKALNLNSLPDDPVQPKQLALKYSREHAKRFHLSYAKQVKLQELHSTSGVVYIQSSRLQRLKRKSLIILSKNTCEPVVDDEEEVVEVAPKQSEPFRVTMISPVSSDDEKTVTNRMISSTPLKNVGMPPFSMESTLPIEPSIIKPTSAAPSKQLVFPTLTNPSPPAQSTSTTDEAKIPEIKETPIQESVVETTKPHQYSVTVATPTRAETAPVLVAEKTASLPGPSIFSGKLLATTTSTPLPTLLPQSSTTVPAEIKSTPSLTTNRSLFSSVGATTSVQPPVGSAASGQGSLFSNFSGGSLFSSLTNATSTAVSSSIDIPVPDTKFSFASPKSEFNVAAALPPVAAASMTSSIFSGKPLQMFDTTSTSQVKSSLPAFSTLSNLAVSSSSTEFSFKTITTSTTTSSGALPSFGNLAAAIIDTCATATVPDGASVSASFTVLPSSSASAMTPSASVFGKPIPTTSSVINSLNFGAIFSGSSFEGNPAISSSAAVTATPVTGQQSSAFSSFSFASKPAVVSSSVTITEVTNDEEKDTNKENNNVGVAPTTSSTLNFASPPVSFSEVKSTTVSSNTVTSVASPSVLPSFATITSTPETTVSTAFSGAIPAAVPAIPATAPSASATDVGNSDSATSIFGGLKLAPASVAGNTSANPPLFGKAQSVSSAPSLFSSSGSNIFSQAANTTAVSTAAESKPLFGSGAVAPLFGQNTTLATDNKNLFGGSSSSNFQSSAASPFSSGGPMFGGGSTFGGANTTQTNTFGSNSGGSMFGSNFTASFQNTGSGFGSPPSFSNNIQQQQPQSSNEGGFGSPATFSNVFNKTGSTFPAFGSAPTFGSSPSFGTSPTKVFGQSSGNMGTFGGTVTQQPTTFDTLANENTLTFGNLAQQQQQPSGFGSPLSFGNTNTNPTFGSNSNFGSSSFSSWR